MKSLKDARKNWRSMDAEARALHLERVMRLAVKDSRTLSVERRDPLRVYGKSSPPVRKNGQNEIIRRIKQNPELSSDYLLEMAERSERDAGWNASV